jgi:UDP:flavonoid glycosyltransferase YjiC (YdhE family)
VSRLRSIFEDANLGRRARVVAEQMRTEDGVKTACDALEGLHARTQHNLK